MNQIIINNKNTPSVYIDEVVVNYIQLVGEDGKERRYSLSSLKHQISVAEFWEGHRSNVEKPREKAIAEACDVLRKNGIYVVDLSKECPEYDDQKAKIEIQKKAIDALKFTIEILCKTINTQRNMIVEKIFENGMAYVVSMVNVDSHDVRYICSTSSRATELFEELRQEAIEDINHEIKLLEKIDAYDPRQYIEHEIAKKRFLAEMKNGMVPPFSVDRPLIEVFPLMTEIRNTVNSINKTNEKDGEKQ